MLNRFANYLTDMMYKYFPTAHSSRPVYVYGFELLLSTGCSVASIMALSAVFSLVHYALLFLGVFMSLRLFNGGFHAKTYEKCFLVTNAVYLIVLLTSLFVQNIAQISMTGYLLISLFQHVSVQATILVALTHGSVVTWGRQIEIHARVHDIHHRADLSIAHLHLHIPLEIMAGEALIHIQSPLVPGLYFPETHGDRGPIFAANGGEGRALPALELQFIARQLARANIFRRGTAVFHLLLIEVAAVGNV